MPERPLLLFPTPETASRSSLGGGRPRFHIPSHDQQSSRLSPKFAQLEASFNARGIEIQSATSGISPEQVLVIETVGSIDNLANAVKKIVGLEWMGELIEEVAPDTDFHETNRQADGRELDGRLYFVMANQRALTELLSLWRAYQQDQTLQFQRGLTKFRDVFKHLKDIRIWGVQDRLNETGVIDAWRKDLQLFGQQPIKFEIELWYRKTSAIRQSCQQELASQIATLNGRILSQSDIEEINYHALLVELPANQIQAIIDNPNVTLVKHDDIMFFRPRGQVCADTPFQINPETDTFPSKPLPAGNPVIALLDGVPLTNHQLLANRLQVDDPNNFTGGYQASEQIHGTAMASLIIHGDLNDVAPPLSTPIYVHPVMKPVSWAPRPPRQERMPDEILAVDIIHRAVKRIFDGEGTQAPTAPTVKFINFSIGDSNRHFFQAMSPLGRLIDWLSAKYNVLFIVSAGNHGQSIDLGMTMQNFQTLPSDERDATVVKAVCRTNHHRKLLSPAESINSLTIGASHSDTASIASSSRINPYQTSTVLPSPISAFGSGYRRSIKPDLIFSGGRQFFDGLVPTSNYLELPQVPAAPGHKVASPGSGAGQLSSSSYMCGTSNATALISRSAGIYHEVLRQIFDANDIDINSPFVAPIVKAMLVHGCSWQTTAQLLMRILSTEGNQQQIITNWIGYGIPDINRSIECTAQRASLIGYGELPNEKAHIFKLPLPPVLGSRTDMRKLTATLAWISPISPSTQKYRNASLWFELENESLVPGRTDIDWRSARRGTIQHEIFTGTRAVPIVEGEYIKIKVNCRQDASRIIDPIRYGLIVSLEVAEGIDINIYNEVRSRIMVPITPDIRA